MIIPPTAVMRLAEFLERHAPVLVLTGAGISTASGIPDYRDHKGAWKRRQPVQHQVFLSDAEARQRYWARSLAGWPTIRNAVPNEAHHKLAELERSGTIHRIVTQNVDRLHQKAGSEGAIDLHGRADEVLCMQCGFRCSRDDFHYWCGDLNPDFTAHTAPAAPDGDADLEEDFSRFEVPDCPRCAGIMKPDVVFFGDNVPGHRVQSVREALSSSGALLVIGSSLMVYSGYRFCRMARDSGQPIALLNLGRTRADELATLKLDARISETLDALPRSVTASRLSPAG
ncbi:MAG: NAD-dependent protein deacetylase [Pseudohongiellaceae bacterium]